MILLLSPSVVADIYGLQRERNTGIVEDGSWSQVFPWSWEFFLNRCSVVFDLILPARFSRCVLLLNVRIPPSWARPVVEQVVCPLRFSLIPQDPRALRMG